MDDRKLSNINLNLINTLDVLLSEKSITKASKKLFVTQSAVSHSLKRLREIFQDELLIKKDSNTQMFLTPFAKNLVSDVRDLVQRIEKVFKMDQFNPEVSHRKVNISTTAYVLQLLVADLIKNINKAAPLMSLNILIDAADSSIEKLNNNDIDIAFGIFYTRDDLSLSYIPLFEDELVCWADSDHDIFKKDIFSLDDYVSYPHLIATYPKCAWASTVEFNNFKDKVKSHNIKSMTVNNLLEASQLLKGTDYLIIGCRKIGETANFKEKVGLNYRSMPLDLPKVRFSICYRTEDKDDKARELTKTKGIL